MWQLGGISKALIAEIEIDTDKFYKRKMSLLGYCYGNQKEVTEKKNAK